MRRIIRAIPVLIAVLAVLCMFSFSASAASIDGISASVTEAAPGDRFTVFIDVPRSVNADTLSVRVEYDPAVFGILSWTADVPNSISNSGDGFFVVTSANAQRVIDLSSGLHFYAEAEVLGNARTGSYDFRLVTSSISYVKDNGYEYVELWSPANRTAKVRVNGSSSSVTTTKKQEAVTRVTERDNTPGETEEIYDPDDPVDPPEDEESIYYDDEDPDEEYEDPDAPADEDPDGDFPEDEPEDDPSGGYTPEPVRNVRISLDSQLTGLSEGKIRLSTKSYFFENDTVVELRDLDPYGADAQHAAANLALEGHDRFAFDITLRETDTGLTLSTLGSGYIEIAMPLPVRMRTSPDAVRVYHIEDGFPRLISSSITVEDGTTKVCFRANAFSPYMIIDTVNEYYPEPEIISGNTTGGSHGRPINPATGVAAAVLIPSALIGCVVLARKTAKRKRARKYQGGENND